MEITDTLNSLRDRLLGRRADSPEAFLRAGGRRAGASPVVVCVGDSITNGLASANYVDLLKQRLGPEGFRFINAGINANLAWNVLQRIDSVIACRPDIVTLLIGTNDVNATFDIETERRYRREQHLPERPSLEWYTHNVEAILDSLQRETNARLIVLDIPILGEDLDGEMNRRVDEYNSALRSVCAERDVPCLPLHDGLVALLPEDGTPPDYASDRNLIVSSTASHILLRRPWNEVSRRNGLTVLTDNIHLNDRGATVIADLLEAQVRQESAASSGHTSD